MSLSKNDTLQAAPQEMKDAISKAKSICLTLENEIASMPEGEEKLQKTGALDEARNDQKRLEDSLLELERLKSLQNTASGKSTVCFEVGELDDKKVVPIDTLQKNQSLKSRLDEEKSKTGPVVKSSESKVILDSYQTKATHADGSYKEGYKKPDIKEDGSIALSFPKPEDAGEFFQAQAKAGVPFMVVDAKTNKVMAYSNGDGTMKNGDGTPYEAKKPLEANGPSKDDFDMSKLEQSGQGLSIG